MFSVDDYKAFKTVSFDELEKFPGYDVLSIFTRKETIVGSHGSGVYEVAKCVIALPKTFEERVGLTDEYSE